MHKNWRWNLHGHISMLPFTLLYALACLVIYRGESWGFRNGVLTCIGPKLGTLIPGTGAQTIGGCQVYADTWQRARRDLHVHENGHIVQQMVCALVGLILTPAVLALLGYSPAWGALGGFLGTPLWGVAYGACFFALWIAQRAGWRKAYRANPFEVQCYDAAAAYTAGTLETRAKAWT